MKTSTSLSALALIAALSTGYAGMAAAQSTTQPNTTQAQPPAAGEDGKDSTVLPRGLDPTAPGSGAAGTGASGRTGTTMDRTAPSGSAGASTSASAAVSRSAIGKDVLNQAGEEVGEIEDIVTDPSSNDVYAVLSVGGFLGIGDKSVLVPIDQLNIGSENVILMSQGTTEDLKSLPSFDENKENYRSMKDEDAGTMAPKQ